MAKRPNMKKQLKKRTEQSYADRDSGNRVNILKLLDNTTFLEVKDKGRYKIDIIPFEIKTDNYPDQNVVKGDWHYKLDVDVHRFVGPGEGNYICPAKNYNKPCPICEEYDRLKKDGDVDDETLKSLKPKRRVIYNIFDHDDEKMKLFETSHFLFEKEILDEALSSGDGEILTFSDIDEGYTVKFRAAQEQIGTQKFNKFKSFSFLEREEPISDEILEQAISLDECLVIPTYDELKAAFHGVDPENTKEDENEDELPKRKSKKTTKKEPESEESEPDDEEYYEKVVNKSKKKQEKKSAKKKKSPKCPSNHVFGDDCEEYDECDECDEWEECSEYTD